MTSTGPRKLVFLDARPVGHETADRHRRAQSGEHDREQARRGAGTEGKAALAGQLGRCQQRQRRQHYERKPAVKVLGSADWDQPSHDGQPDRHQATGHREHDGLDRDALDVQGGDEQSETEER